MKKYISAEHYYGEGREFTENSKDRQDIAYKTKSLELMEVYVCDPDPDVRQSLADNYYASADILDMLAADEQDFVRQTVAYNKNASLATLKKLAKDPSAWVRGAVATSRNTPSKLLDTLAKDPDNYVSSLAKRNPRFGG